MRVLTFMTALWLVMASMGCNSLLGNHEHGISTGSGGAIAEVTTGGASGTGGGGAGGATGNASAGSAGGDLSGPAATDGGDQNETGVDGPIVDAPGAELGACTNQCTAGAAQCASGGVQICKFQNGCAQWVTTAPCGANQACAVGTDGIPACQCKSNVCTQVGTVCQDAQAVATCAKDANGCFAIATSACDPGKSCSGMAPNATCALTCADSCSSGQKACMNGQLATCTLGGNGCRAYGTPVACGARQTCMGAAGSGACTCNADPTCAAAGNICTSATSTATCTADAQGCVYQSASSTCTGQGCVSGSCSGVCAPAAMQCVTGSNVTQTCGTNGQWGTATACPVATPICSGPGVCGVCAIGTTKCAATGNAVQVCGASGQWGTASACNAQACVTGKCVGICAPGATQCAAGSPKLQTCNSDGTWSSGIVTINQCGAVCSPATAQCVGPAGASQQTCDVNGQWGTAVVVAGKCGTVCSPGSTQCSGAVLQTCGSTGQWLTGAVTAGSCGAVCTPGFSGCGFAGSGSTAAWTCYPGNGACWWTWSAPNLVYQELCTASGQWTTNYCTTQCAGSGGGTFYSCKSLSVNSGTCINGGICP
jgi:hypothetical protein